MRPSRRIIPILSAVVLVVSISSSFAGGSFAAQEEVRQAGHLVDVYVRTGGRQCETHGGVALEEMQRRLIDADIEVHDATTGIMTGMHFITVCGAPHGGIHVFTIDGADVARARDLGFAETSELPNAGYGEGWEPIER